jgi:glycosyltransferase involved in cell wall biosynthesis
MLADCYVFPPLPGSSLNMPLSVLEAMACNLPVVTTRFQGLDTFREGDGLVFVDRSDDLAPRVQELLESCAPPATREKIQDLSWQSVATRLQTYYEGLF